MVVKVHNPYSLEEKHEECGIVGIYSKKGEDVAPYLYRALVALQHRGQDAAGLAVHDGKKIEARRGIGLVDMIFRPEDLAAKGRTGIGHTRYPTFGECRMCDVQPMVYKNYAAAHNGHLANGDDVRKALEKKGYTFTSSVDSEVVVFMFEEEKDIGKAVKRMMDELEGAFSITCIVDGKLVVFRDRFAIRPLVWGENEDFICFASETVALDVNGIPYKGDIGGGMLAVVDKGKIVQKRIAPESRKHCMFEYVYFSRPDTIMNGRSVYEARKELGKALAKEAPVKADVVIPVPDTSRTASASFAAALGIPCEEGLIKNRYIGRTFIMPDQSRRVDAVKLKLNPVREIIAGKSVVLVDDSIVRGTTLKEITALVRKAGAKEVHLRITCPPVKAPCFYGVDMSTYSELIASRKSVEEIRKFLNADSLAYISIEGMKRAVGLPVCTGCLNEDYHTDYVRKLARRVKAADG
ncbi:MAG TPA: amidophosphoribosyltransferase [Candidatus Bilamarchaeum sp.]|nr:amidophosphoribosyltransferase [Candidatus Bilamarchaeum sp.]